MSANLLNLAAQPASGAAATGSGIGAQAAAAAKNGAAQGPMAGFEALLAAFFGDEELGTVNGTPGAKATDKTTSSETEGDQDDSQSVAATDVGPAAATTVPDATLALLAQGLPTAPAANVCETPTGETATPPTGGDAAGGKGPAVAQSQIQLAGQAALAEATASDADDATADTVPAAKDQVLTAKLDLPVQSNTDPAPIPRPASPAMQAAQVAAAAPDPVAAQATVETALQQVASATVAPPPAPPTQAKPAEATAAAGAKDKAQPAKSAGVATARVDLTANPAAQKTSDLLQAVSDGAPRGQTADQDAEEPFEPKARAAADTPATPASLDTASTTTPATLIHAAGTAVRGSPQTVANLAAQIAKKLDGRSSRFDVQLDPAGLGKVDVRIEIGASGRMTAAMSFDTPQAAAELRARANELQRALEQAGFDLSGGMSFDVTDNGSQGRSAQGQNDSGPNTGAAFRGRAFQAALENSGDESPANTFNPRRNALAGVDIRI